MALNASGEASKSDYDGGKEARRALASADRLRFLDFLPLPRSLIALICILQLSSASSEYRNHNYDEYGLGGGTLGEVDGRLFFTFLLGLPLDAVLIWLIFF